MFLPHIHMRIEREHLEDKGDVALRSWLLSNLFASDIDLARGGQLQAGDHPKRRGLAAATRPEQHEELAIFDFEGRRLAPR